MNIDDSGKATKAVVATVFRREPNIIIIEMINVTIDALLNIDRFAPSFVSATK